jgi:integrase
MMAVMARNKVEAYTVTDGTHYRVRFRLDGTAKVRTWRTLEAADEFARLIDQVGAAEAVHIADHRKSAPRNTATLGAYAIEHVESMTGVGDDYRRRCLSVINRDLANLGRLPLTVITPTLVGKWVNALEKAGQSGKTIKNKHGFLSAVMAHAMRDGKVDANPCAGTRLPRSVAPSMTFLTPDEYARFLGYFTPYWQPMVALLFGTGARFSELTALTVGDVDLELGVVVITKAWKDGGKKIGPPKSRRAVRTLSLAPETIEVLRPLVAGRAGDALLLRNQVGGPVRLQTFHDNVWRPAVRLANGEPAQEVKRVARRRDARGNLITPAVVPLGKRPRVHDARHSCASWLLASGAPLNVVQYHLGHESIVTTSDRYGHLLPSARSAVANALSLALTQAHPQVEA